MNIILSSIKRGLRDKGVLVSNMFLILVLPYIFSLIFSSQYAKENIDLNIIGNKNSEIIKSYVDTLEKYDEENKNLDMNYRIYNKEDYEKNKDENSKLSIIIDEEHRSINFKQQNNVSIGIIAIQALTKEYFNSIATYESIITDGNTPVYNKDILKISNEKIDKKYDKNLAEIDYDSYFAVVMLQMATLVSAIYVFKNTFYLKEKLGQRVKSSPVKISKLISKEIIGGFILIFTQSLVMLGIIVGFYGVKINLENILGILLLLGLLTLLAVALGIFSMVLAKKQSIGENICSMVVTVITLVSGTLMPQMDIFEKIFIVKINPFYWINKELNSLINLNTYENIYTTLIISIGISLILAIISTIILNKKVVK